MKIGVPRERKTLEKRVALTPDGVRELVKYGHTVLVEKNAGAGSFLEDSDYESAGAKIISSLEGVWKEADLLVKVKEPDMSEYSLMRPGLLLFDYLHLASLPEVAKALCSAKVTSIAYELVKTVDGRLPLLEPMSEVAGKLSVLNGGAYLLQQHGGRGILLGGTVAVPPANITILGAGIAGRAACEAAVGSGAIVTVLDLDYAKLDRLKIQFGSRVRTILSNRATLEREVATADLLIGAVLVPGAAAPRIITRQMIKSMRRGSVFVDISIDQGGCAETSKPTNLDAPTYVEEGVVHYGVCNMPAQVPCTSTAALTGATLPYIVKIANGGEAFTKSDPVIAEAVNTRDGKVVHAVVAQALGTAF